MLSDLHYYEQSNSELDSYTSYCTVILLISKIHSQHQEKSKKQQQLIRGRYSQFDKILLTA